MAISTHNLARAIYESSIDKKGKDLDAILQNATHLIAEKHLLGKTEEILTALERIIDEKSGVVRARITSSKKLSRKHIETIEKELKKRYSAKEIILIETEDAKLLDGMKIQVRDEQIDLTLSGRMEQLQKYLLNN